MKRLKRSGEFVHAIPGSLLLVTVVLSDRTGRVSEFCIGDGRENRHIFPSWIRHCSKR